MYICVGRKSVHVYPVNTNNTKKKTQQQKQNKQKNNNTDVLKSK